MTEFKCSECEKNFVSQEYLEQHNKDKHCIGVMSKHELKQLKKQKREKQDGFEKRKSNRSKLIKRSLYVAVPIILIVATFAFISSQPPTTGTPTEKVTAQPVKQAESQNFPVKALGNYYKYSNQPSGTDGKVRVLFIGAEFCPFCAAERWPIVESLNNFDTFSGLKETTSASFNEPFLDLPTYNFMGAKYDSSFVKFDHKETANRNFQRLESLTSEEQRLFNTYNPRGSIPFLFIGGQKGIFVQVGSGYSPGTIQGLTFSQIKDNLDDLSAKTTQSIMKEANIITALICYNNKASDVCSNPEISALVAQIG